MSSSAQNLSSLGALFDGPSRFNNYKTTGKTTLNYILWNATVGDLALRMIAVEEKATGYQQVIDLGIGIALDRINDALAPAVTQVQALINQTNGYLTQLKANTIGAALIVTTPDLRFVTDAQISEIGRVPAVESAINALIANALQRGRAFYFATM